MPESKSGALDQLGESPINLKNVKYGAINIVMNILVLTPDRVGSTLLQRFLTVKMQTEHYDRPVINLHELTNGIVKEPGSSVLSKPAGGMANWKYFQSLSEVIDILESADHYKTARLAKYHIKNRQDSMPEQLKFYRYLNDNFFIIACNRSNLFEHALSWAFYAYTKRLNVFSPEEKQALYQRLTANKLYIDPTILVKHLDNYVEYQKWVDDHFHINATFNYEKDSKDLEGYCDRLNIFDKNNTWKNAHGMSWNDYNKCHYILSDTSNIALKLDNISTPIALFPSAKKEPTDIVPCTSQGQYQLVQKEFLEKNIIQYNHISNNIGNMIANGVMPAGIPIKLQTLAEKYMLVQNINEVLDAYNNWALQKVTYPTYSVDQLAGLAVSELQNWYNRDTA